MPVGKPAPPRPRRLDAFTSARMPSGPISRHFFHMENPPCFTKLSIFVKSTPKWSRSRIRCSGMVPFLPANGRAQSHTFGLQHLQGIAELHRSHVEMVFLVDLQRRRPI